MVQTARYQIAELREGETGGFCPRGAVKELWQTRDFEAIVSGPAETGKTWGCCNYIDALLWKYPGAQGVMARKTYSSLVGSAIKTFIRVIGPDSPIKAYGGEKPEWFQYPNGSRLWVIGLDNPGKALSSERDFFYVNQAEEFTLEDWETLTTRCTGRGAVMPYTRMFGDANPGPPSHWIKTRQGLRLLESRHEDNPTLFDEAGNITPQGVRSLAILDSLTGSRYQRLRLGKWVQAEGAVYEAFDRALHIKRRPFEIPREWRRIRSIDFGYTNPFCCQWWAIDPDGRMYLYREIYQTQRLVADLTKQIIALSGNEHYEATIADHDAEDRATMKAAGIQTVAAWKSVSPGIQAVQQRLKVAGDNKARIFLLEGALVEPDQELLDKKKPTCTEQEFEVYLWAKGADGKPNKEEPVKEYDHGMDTMRYAVAYVDKLSGSKTVTVSTYGSAKAKQQRRQSEY